MNPRQRFQKIINFEPVDRLPVLALEPYEIPVIERWRKEGMPANQSPEQYLSMDYLNKMHLGLCPIPAFEIKRLSETADEQAIHCCQLKAIFPTAIFQSCLSQHTSSVCCACGSTTCTVKRSARNVVAISATVFNVEGVAGTYCKATKNRYLRLVAKIPDFSFFYRSMQLTSHRQRSLLSHRSARCVCPLSLPRPDRSLPPSLQVQQHP